MKATGERDEGKQGPYIEDSDGYQQPGIGANGMRGRWRTRGYNEGRLEEAKQREERESEKRREKKQTNSDKQHSHAQPSTTNTGFRR